MFKNPIGGGNMMNVIKNIKLIYPIVDLMSYVDLETAGKMYMRQSRIEFKVLDVNNLEVTIRAVQTKSPAENYLTQSELIERTKTLFSKFIKDREIHVHAIPFTPSPVDDVNPDWIKSEMNVLKVSLKTLVKETGIDKSNLSAWINDVRPMSQPVKAMFYNFFKAYAIENFVETVTDENFNGYFAIKKFLDKDFFEKIIQNSKCPIKITEDESHYKFWIDRKIN